MRYIVTNFAYGTGPYLRTTELAIALNQRLFELGRERLGIIVPWVYGEKQRSIMREEFGGYNTVHPGEILLDSHLGVLLRSVFYGNNTYEQALSLWVERGDAASREAQSHLLGILELEDLSGRRVTVAGGEIVLELNRAPRLTYAVAPSYSATFAHISAILRAVLEVPEAEIRVDRELVRRAIPLAERIERLQRLHFVAEPGTFSYLGTRMRYPNEESSPPIARPLATHNKPLAPGIYVTVTGIPGLERLYQEARGLGLTIYTNDPEAVPGAKRLLPHVIPNPAIKFQFARSGWGSIWNSQLSGTPFVTPAYDPTDDPEIYFNNRCLEELGLGISYRRESFKKLLELAEALRPRIKAINRAILARFGTYDGNRYIAERIVDRHFTE